MENNEKIAVLLKEVGVAPANHGWRYLVEAINMVLEDASALDGVTKVIYPTIAKKYGATCSSVERAIRYSVTHAFEIMPDDVRYYIFGHTTRRGGYLTNGEFIGTLAELITTEPNNPIWMRSI